MAQSSSTLFRLDGVTVQSVQIGPDGTRTVRVLTTPQWVGCVPHTCRGLDQVERLGAHKTPWHQDRSGSPESKWRKRKWLCTNRSCERKSFTESTPQIPPRARITIRAKAEMALVVLDDDRSVKAVATAYGCAWNTCHDAVVATADPVLDAEPGPVVVLGIDETR